jgi:hypothetical protein
MKQTFGKFKTNMNKILDEDGGGCLIPSLIISIIVGVLMGAFKFKEHSTIMSVISGIFGGFLAMTVLFYLMLKILKLIRSVFEFLVEESSFFFGCLTVILVFIALIISSVFLSKYL